MFRRRSHLSHLCKWWKTYRGYWPFNNEHDLLNINHKLYQRVSSFSDNEGRLLSSKVQSGDELGRLFSLVECYKSRITKPDKSRNSRLM